MKRSIFFSLLLVFTSLSYLRAEGGDPYAYIERYKDIAIAEMKRAGIPASIKLAQGMLESAVGTSELARKANNHFGIKCHNDWTGKKMWRLDDDVDENGKPIKSCFRVYKKADESYVAHSEFLRDPKKEYRYGFLFFLDPTDYRGWAKGLQSAGYATSPTYASKLINLIERYELYEYDKMGMEEPVVIEEPDKPLDEIDMVLGITYNNDTRMVLAKAGETLADIETRTAVPVAKLMKYNEGYTSPSYKLKEGDIVYLEPKRNYFRGFKKWHYVKEGETMFYISQLYGIKLSKLYDKNNMPEGSQPAAGERIRLRGKTKNKEDRPRLISEPPKPKPAVEDSQLSAEDAFWSMDNPFSEGAFGDEDEPEENPIPDTSQPPEQPEESQPEQPDKPDKPVTTPADLDKPEQPEEPTAVEKPDEEELPMEITPENPPEKPEKPEEPQVDKPDKQPETPTPPPATEEGRYHIVQKGDTLYSLSRRYGTTVEQIRKWNGLPDNIIKIGQKLRVKE